MRVLLEEQLQHCIEELKQGVLEVLIRHINEAFARALAPLELIEPARAAPPSRPRVRRSNSRPHAEPQHAVLETASTLLKNGSEPAAAPPATPRRSRAKGPSREEIDRLVEAGLASRLASQATATAPNSDA
jgi:hypothetical protein